MDEVDDYDALNEETFGSAINDDWEGEHENLVLLDSNGNSSSKEKDETDDGDLGDLGEFEFTSPITHKQTKKQLCSQIFVHNDNSII